MKIYKSSDSTEVIYRDDSNWQRTVWGKYKPSVTITDITAYDVRMLVDFFVSKAKKAENITDMAKYANAGAELQQAWLDAQAQADEDNQTAEEKAAEHRSEDAVMQE